MNFMEIVITVIQLIACVAIICVVLLQSGKSAGLSSAIAGGNNNSFLARNKAKSLDAQLAKATKWLAIVVVILTLLLNFM